MSFWTDFRDGLQAVASVAVNFFYPGLGSLLSNFASEGAQNHLYGNPYGSLVMAGSSMLGGFQGNMANYGNTLNALSSLGQGADAAGGFSGAFGGTGAGGINPEQLAEVRNMIDMGYTPDQAIQTVGMSPQQAQLAGIPTSGAGPMFEGQNMPGAYGNVGGPDDGLGSGLFAPGTGGGTSLAGGPTGVPYGAGYGTANALQRASAGTGAMPWSSPAVLSNIIGGAYGFQQARNLKDWQKQADPFAQYRGRYGERLNRLSADPSSIQNEPGYAAGMQAIERSMAAQGYTGSGNSATSMMKYGGDFYNATMDRYAQLAGGGVNPAAAAQLGMQSEQYGIDLARRSLGQMTGYPATLTGNRWPGQQP